MKSRTRCDGRYQIEIDGWLDETWATWFSQMTLTTRVDDHGRSVTVLEAYLPDQSRLRGILNRIWDLNLCVISVKYVAQS